MKLNFEKGTAKHIVESFGKTVDEKGNIIDKDTGARVEYRGKAVTIDNLAMVEDGSDIFVDDRFASLVDYVERNR